MIVPCVMCEHGHIVFTQHELPGTHRVKCNQCGTSYDVTVTITNVVTDGSEISHIVDDVAG